MQNRKLRKNAVLDLAGQIVGYECPEKNIKLIVCDKKTADDIIIPNHYSHKAQQNAFLNMLVLYNGKPGGAIQLGFGIRPKIKGSLDPSDTREFDRMYLMDELPKFSETIVLSLLIHFLKKAHPEIKHIISYADTSAGKTGTIYKAGNFRFEKAIKSDFYILPSGERIHPVTMWHRHGTRRMDFLKAQYPGIKKAEGFQLKFVYDL